MKKKALTLLVFILIACNNIDLKTTNYTKKEIPVKEDNSSDSEKINLKFEDFKNSKWIIGEKGLNGELPDTIFFNSPNQLTYISTETGKEFCEFYFNKDTLIFTDHTNKYIEDEEIICESINYLLYHGDKFIYKYYKEKCDNTEKYNFIDMSQYNLFFKKIL